MATQKIGLTKLGLKKNTNLIPLEWGDQVIQIREYLSIEDKIGVIERIVNQSLDNNNFANPARIMINTVLEVIFAYTTNINFTDKQKEDRLGLYDLLVSSGLWKAIENKLAEVGDLSIIQITVREVIDEIYKYKNSTLGILQAVSEDYSNLELNINKLQEEISNPENAKLLKNVIDKMG